MATTKRVGKEKRGLSPPAALPKDVVATTVRPSSKPSPSTDKEISPIPKRNYLKSTVSSTPNPCKGKKTLPQSSTTVEAGKRLTRIKSMERPPSAPQPSKNLTLNNVKNKTLKSSSSSSSTLPRGVAATTTTPPKPRPDGKTVRPHGKVQMSTARGRRPISNATKKVVSSSSSRSSCSSETNSEAEVVVAPVAKVTPEDEVIKVDAEVEQQCHLLDSTQFEDHMFEDLPDPERTTDLIADTGEEEVEVGVVANDDEERDEPIQEQPNEEPKDGGKGEEVRSVEKEKTMVVKRQGKEAMAYNDVIEETRSKLVEKKKSKVLALVGAFETVISLQEPETAQVNQPADDSTVTVDTTSTAASGSAGDEQDGGLDKSIAGKEEEETTTATATAM